MTHSPPHVNWLIRNASSLKTADQKDVEIWEFQHQNDENILSAWAKHFWTHYCPESDIDFMRGKKSRKEYLTDIKFPSISSKLGPGIRAGDFGEILMADYLQWILGYWVPRVRWGSKGIRDESFKGCDVVGFKFFNDTNEPSINDILATYEAKTKFSKGVTTNRLQDAINHSVKDEIRIDESLNFIKQKLYELKNLSEAKLIERFQDPVDSQYQRRYGAVALYSDEEYKESEILLSDTSKVPATPKATDFMPHPNRDKLTLLVIKGPNMMNLVHELYRRSADEA
jgi:hypothetical protein